MKKATHLPAYFPTGTKYVLEQRGPLVRRYVEFPDGRRLELGLRKAQTCQCEARRELGLALDGDTAPRKKSVKVAA